MRLQAKDFLGRLHVVIVWLGDCGHGSVHFVMNRAKPAGLDSPLLPKVFRYATRAHVWIYRRTNGRIGGRPAHPQWYLNLLANPDTQIQVDAEHLPVQARTASPDERPRLA
jgi:hypothetical protein